MSEMQGAVRMNISVPRELKERMDGIKEPVNWSSVAAEAFRQRILELTSKRKGLNNMEDVITRMKAAEEMESNSDFKAGKKAGESWAKECATPRQLRRLDNMDYQTFFQGVPSDQTGWGGVLLRIILGKDFENSHEVIHFWENALGDDCGRIADQDFARGFTMGALGVWEVVEKHL